MGGLGVVVVYTSDVVVIVAVIISGGFHSLCVQLPCVSCISLNEAYRAVLPHRIRTWAGHSLT